DPTVGEVHERDPLDREAGDLPAAWAPARPGICAAIAEDNRAGAVGIGDHQLSLGPVLVAADRLRAGQAAVEELPAVPRELRRRLVELGRPREISPGGSVRPAEEQVPIPRLRSRGVDDPSPGADLLGHPPPPLPA